MFAIEITSFASSSRGAAFGCRGVGVDAGAAFSLHDASATTRKSAVRSRIGSRKIAKQRRLDKRDQPATQRRARLRGRGAPPGVPYPGAQKGGAAAWRGTG